MAACPSICDNEILRLVKLVYEAAEDPALWHNFLGRVGVLMNATASTMEAYDQSQRSGNVGASSNLDPELLQQYDYFAPKNLWQKGGSARYPIARAVTGSMYVTDNTLFRSEFYQDFLRHMSIFHLAGGVLLKDGDHNASVSFFRPRGNEAFGPEELALLNVLLPHIKQALHIHRRISIAEGGRRAISEALDRMPIGVLVVDDCSRVLAANRRAAEILAEGKGLSSEPGGLRAAIPSQTSKLRNLVAGAAETSRGAAFHPGGVLKLERPSLQGSLSVRVVPLSSHSCLADHVQAAAIIFVSDSITCPTVSHLAALYCLTPAEERLATKLIEGQTLDEIAAALQISRNTAATQLKSVFQKTGTHRQTDLVRLLLSSVAALIP